ncbi:hypothetical protein RE0346_01180 [Prescottella equi]|nr:hypothetical protein RE0346_01180 [Prescottella equi]
MAYGNLAEGRQGRRHVVKGEEMSEVVENSETVDHDAEEAVDGYDRSVRNAVLFVAAGLGMYALLTGAATLNSWWFDDTRPDGDGSPNIRIVFTLDLPEGAAVLGVLTTLIIALHVAAWQIKPSGPLANLAHARRKVLSGISIPVGFIAVATGAAILLHGAPDTIGVGPIALALAAVVVAVFAADIHSVLDTNRDIYRQIDDVSWQREVAALENVIDHWSTTRKVSAATTLKDLTKVVASTALPMVIIICATASLRSVGGSLLQVGIAVLIAAGWVAVSLFVVYRGVLSFVTRSHFDFLMSVLVGAGFTLVWVTAGMSVWASSAGLAAKSVLMVALLCVSIAPPALVGNGLRKGAAVRMPGSSARPNAHSALEKRYQRLVSWKQTDGPTAEAERTGCARISHWYKRVTGTMTEQSHGHDPRRCYE